MNCPNCHDILETIQYEGIAIETCGKCQGEWLDSDEIGKIARIREVRFDPDERRAIAGSTTIQGVVLEAVDRDLTCPKCGATTAPINYGGDTGIVINRCTVCRGFWLDDGELKKIQMVIEGWQKYGQRLRDVAVEVDRNDDVQVSRLPFVGPFINSAINGILDLMG